MSSSDLAVSVRGLSKCYQISDGANRPTTAMEAMANTLRRLTRPASREFWALNDVSFDVYRGEVVGILGRNGAGKSTLLKVLSRITEPTAGEIDLYGRVGSLLEVGTGFHQELTGRENIFLNGAILGMKRSEIARVFDAIVDFSGVEQFLDTPVKRYSSGMYTRLAFAVAAHLNPEILIIDEVLAVGDAAFQKKCLGKMEDVAKSGRTVFFVSHNIGALQSLCTRALHLRSGKLIGDGPVDEQAALYLDAGISGVMNALLDPVKITNNLSLTQLEANPSPVEVGDPLDFTLELATQNPVIVEEVFLLIFSSQGTRVSSLDLRNRNGSYRLGAERRLILTGHLDSFPLIEDDYRLGVYVKADGVGQNFFDLIALNVIKSQKPGDLFLYPPRTRGFVELNFLFDAHESNRDAMPFPV